MSVAAQKQGPGQRGPGGGEVRGGGGGLGGLNLRRPGSESTEYILRSTGK